MVWFNVCLSMFERQPLFDALLLPAIDNPAVTAITFVLDERQREKWERHVRPKVSACGGGGAKVAPPVWASLPGGRLVHPGRLAGEWRHGMPAQLLGRAFHVPPRRPHIPRYIFHVTGHSELIERLVELDREHRLS